MSHKDQLPIFLHRAYDIFLSELEHYHQHISELSEFDKDHAILLQDFHRLAGGASFVHEKTLADLAFEAEHIVDQILRLKANATDIMMNSQEIETLTQQGKYIILALLAECELIIDRNSSSNLT